MLICNLIFQTKMQNVMKEASKSCSDLDQEVGSNMDEDDQCATPGHLIYKLRQQLIEKDNTIKTLGSEYDHNLSKVLSSLLFLEGKLHREQKQIVRLMEQKDIVITQQEEHIKQLCKRIRILQSSISDFQSRVDSNGINQSVQENCMPPPDTPIVVRAQPSKKYFAASELSLSSSSLPQTSEGGNIFRNLSKPLREKFSRNKSNVDLRSFKRINGDEMCYRSMENITQVVRREKKPRDKERCMSIAGYPNYEDYLNDPELTTFMKQIHSDNSPSNPSLPDIDRISLSSTLPNSLSSSPSSYLKSRTDDLRHSKESSRSMSNLQQSKSKSDLPQKPAPPAETPTTPHHSETSNPFKMIRDTLKRKGSKQVKTKKQSFSLLHNSNHDTGKKYMFYEKS